MLSLIRFIGIVLQNNNSIIIYKIIVSVNSKIIKSILPRIKRKYLHIHLHLTPLSFRFVKLKCKVFRQITKEKNIY